MSKSIQETNEIKSYIKEKVSNNKELNNLYLHDGTFRHVLKRGSDLNSNWEDILIRTIIYESYAKEKLLDNYTNHMLKNFKISINKKKKENNDE